MKLEELRLLKEEIIREYYNGLSLEKLGKLFSSRKTSIKTILEENGIVINKYGAAKNRGLNHKYFESIDTPEKAYFVGFLFADGSVCWRERETVKSGTVQIGVSETDIDIIEKFLKAIKATYSIHHGRGSASVKITSNGLVKSLEAHNVIPNKTYEAKHLSKNIPKEFEVDFLRGLIDGDGSIYLDERGNKRISFISYSEEVVKEFQERVDSLIGKEIHSKLNKQVNGYTATWSGRIQVEKNTFSFIL